MNQVFFILKANYTKVIGFGCNVAGKSYENLYEAKLACSLCSFCSCTPLILPLACSFACFRTSHYEMRLLVSELLLPNKQILLAPCDHSPHIPPLILPFACSFACFRTSHYETRLRVSDPLVTTQANLACSL